MRGSAWLAAVGLTLGVLAGGCNDPTKGQTIFQAQLMGANEVPPRTSSGSGAAGFTLDGNVVHFSVEVEGLGNIVACHIHVGAVWVSGPVRVPLCKAPLPNGVVNGVLHSALNFITSTPPAGSYASPTVQTLWDVVRAIVERTVRSARDSGRPFKDVLENDAEIRRYLDDRDLGSAFDPRQALGETSQLIDRALEQHQKLSHART